MPTLSRQLAEALCRVNSDQIDPETLQAAGRFVLDWLASALAGTATPAGRMLIDEGRQKGIGNCDVLGIPERRDGETAALVNGGLSHIVEMDDLDRTSVVHPGTVVIPSALAASQEIGAGGKAFLAAVVVGYEAAIRIGEAVGRAHYKIWQSTATCGPFGAAAAAGHVLGLDPERLTWAFGNAGSLASGLWQFNHDGAMTKHLHAGRAAANGFSAARLACRGFTGATAILEGPQGFFAAMAKDAMPRRVIEGLAHGLGSAGCPWKIHGVSIKPHASCRHTHPAIDAALALSATLEEEKLDDIERVVVSTYRAALDITDTPSPQNAYQAKFSLQYCVAQAIRGGRVGLPDFGPKMIDDPGLRSLMRKIELRVDEEFDARYPNAWSARVRIELGSGASMEREIVAPKGDPENPVSVSELAEKLDVLTAGTPYAGRAAHISQKIGTIARLNSMRGMLSELAPARLPT